LFRELNHAPKMRMLGEEEDQGNNEGGEEDDDSTSIDTSISSNNNNIGQRRIMSLKARLLVMWLPLFCNVRSAHDAPSFSASEKSDLLLILEHTIGSLCFWEQEIVLSCWLQLFARSPFDWPNLQRCFESWLYCHRSAPYT
jgi:hypothetical protein